MKLKISNFSEVFIPCEDALADRVLKATTFDNPEYEKKQRLGLFTRNTPKTFTLAKKQSMGVLVSSSWLFSNQYKTLIGEDFALEETLIYNKPKRSNKFRAGSSIVLRSYQISAVKAMTDRYVKHGFVRGIIQGTTGSGKTITGIATALELGYKTIWLTHKVELLEQTYEAFKNLTGVSVCRYSGGNKEDYKGKQVIIATYQSLMKNAEMLEYINKNFDTMVVDECHHTPSNYFLKAVSELYKVKNIIGLTATPIRKDGLQPVMLFHVGSVLHKMNRTQMEQHLIFPKVEYHILRYNYYGMSTNEMSYVKTVNDLVRQEERMDYVIDVINKDIQGHYGLVLTEYVALGEEMFERVRHLPGVNAIQYNARLPKKAKDKAMRAIRSKKYNLIIATNIAREGLDLPHLDRLYLVTPKKGDSDNKTPDGTGVEQEVGRIMRTAEGKVDAKVVDFVDWNIDLFKRQWYSRKKTYERIKLTFNKIDNTVEEEIDFFGSDTLNITL